jgi:hypothetical protein
MMGSAIFRHLYYNYRQPPAKNRRKKMPNPAWFMSHSAHTRYTTGALAYFAQGIPMGLLHIALPAWLSTQGVSAVKIAAFLSVIMLPWSAVSARP